MDPHFFQLRINQVKEQLPDHKFWTTYYVVQMPDANYHVPLMTLAIHEALENWFDQETNFMDSLLNHAIPCMDGDTWDAFQAAQRMDASLVKPYAEKVLREPDFEDYWGSEFSAYGVYSEKITTFLEGEDL